MKIKIVVTLGLCLVILLLSACEVRLGADTAGVLTVAVIAPFSGDFELWGQSTRNGVVLAVEAWNQRGGVLGSTVQVALLDSKCDYETAREVALEAVDLLDRAEHYPRQLSGGQEQRIGIARAIVAHPKVVVADEPTGDLDADTSEQILRLLKRLNAQLNVTLLMVTHDAEAAAIAQRQFRLDHGKLIQTGGDGVQPAVYPDQQESAG